MQPFVVETWPNPPEESGMRFVSTFVAFCFCVIAAQAELSGSRPNLVLIIADDMAWDDCSLYGNKGLPTPNIDRMAAEGMRFDRAFLTISSCSPSRASISQRAGLSALPAHSPQRPAPLRAAAR